MKRNYLIPTLLILFVLGTLTSFISKDPSKSNTSDMPENVKAIVDNSCFGCHNTSSKNDDAKEKLDFNKLEGLSTIKKISAYKNIGETLEENEMPPKKFLDRYPEKKLSEEQKKVMISWAKKEAESLVKSKSGNN